MKKSSHVSNDVLDIPVSSRDKPSGVFPVQRGPGTVIAPPPIGLAIAQRHVTFIKTVLPRFGPVEADMWDGILPLMRIVRLERGGHFLKAGGVAHAFGWLVRGVVREYYVTPNGREHNRAFCWEGLPFGSLMDLISPLPPITFIEALEDVEALVVAWSDFEALCARDARWHIFARRVTEMLLVTKLRREHDLLTLDAEARYERLLERAPGIEARVPLYHLASYLGIRHEHLSRIRRRRTSATID